MKFSLLYFSSLVLKVSWCLNVTFWHICDIHLNESSLNHTKYRDSYEQDTSISLLKSVILEMRNLSPNPDFLIWNGDNIRHYKIDDSKYKAVMNAVVNEISKILGTMKVLPSLGNHDINPPDCIKLQENKCEVIYDYWKHIIKLPESIDSFKKGCYYSYRSKGIKIIVLNTVLWYSANICTVGDDPLDQFSWLESELKQSKNASEKVFIVGHVPPGAAEYTPWKYKHMRPQYNKRFLKILQNFSVIIEAGFFSHQHTDAFKVIRDQGNTKPLIPIFISPSVTPFRLPGLGSPNPSIRLYNFDFDRNSSKYTQYHTVIRPSQDNQKYIWNVEYESTKLISRLSAHDLDQLLIDLSSPDSKKFHLFFKYHLSSQNHEDNNCPVKSNCRCRILCGLRHIEYELLDSCLKTCPSVSYSNSQIPLIASVIVVFTLILIVVVLWANKTYCHQRRNASLTRDIHLATYNGKDCEQVFSEHVDHIVETTFADVPEYRGHFRNNSRTILTLHDGNEITEKSQPVRNSKFSFQNKNKSQEKYDYTRM